MSKAQGHAPRFVLMVLVVGLALMARAACAQDAPVVTASVDANDPYVHDSTTYTISVEGVDRVDAIPIDPVDGLDIQFIGTTQQRAPVVVINGRRQDTGRDKYLLRYRVTPRRSGNFVIPAQTLTINGQQYSTPSVSLRARDADVSSRSPVIIEVDRDEVFVGEPVRVRVAWYVSEDITNRYQFHVGGHQAAFEMRPIPVSQMPGGVGSEARTVAVNGERVGGRLAVGVVHDGKQYRYLIVFEHTYVPTRAGQVSIGPVNVSYEVVVERGGFFPSDKTRRAATRTLAVPINVKPLPEAGRPADFDGFVGNYSLEARATPTDIHVGDPIELKLTVRGPEPLERVNPPDLAAHPRFGETFKYGDDPWEEPDSRRLGERVFTAMIRARDEDVSEIPSLGLSTFDTDSAQYRTVTTEPIPLTVRRTRQVTAQDAVVSGSAMGNIERMPLMDAEGGIRANYTAEQALGSQTLLSTVASGSRLLIFALAAPPVVFGVLWLVLGMHRRHDAQARRRRRALTASLRLLNRSGPPHERIDRAIRTYIAHRFEIKPEAVTPHDCDRLAGMMTADETTPSLGTLLRRCDASLYAANGSVLLLGEDAIPQAVAALRGAHRELAT